MTQILRDTLNELNSDDDLRELYSQDIWAKGQTAEGVLSPTSTEEVSRLIKSATAKGLSVNPRGSGMSYTKGYVSDKNNTVMIDFSKMDQIVEINEADMYVTVQAGCTWKTLYDALSAKGLRTPFWGPLSGLKSTIGGGLSQNNAFFGAGLYDTSTASVLSVTVVLADGSIIKTGTASAKGAKPFYRHYGPDLTGIFMGDTGALGYKTEATLRLIPMPEYEAWASFEFKTHDPWVAAQVDMSRTNLASELFGFDPNLQRVRMERASFASDVKTLGKVVTQQKGGILKGIKEGAKVALAGRGFMDDVAYSAHIVVEGHSQAEVDAKIETLKSVCVRHGGNEIENSIPKIIRANPFTPLNNILGPRGERWVPVHGIVAMSDALSCANDIGKFFDDMAPEFEKFDITTGYLLTNMTTTGFLIEPVFIWPEEIWPIHEQTVENSVLKRVISFESNPDATECVTRARQAVIEIFKSYGAAHFQIGRTYPFKDSLSPETLALLEHIKAFVDPDNQINPGSLGLG